MRSIEYGVEIVLASGEIRTVTSVAQVMGRRVIAIESIGWRAAGELVRECEYRIMIESLRAKERT